MWMPETFHAPAVALVLLALFVCFVREWLKPDVAVGVAVAVLLVLGLISQAGRDLKTGAAAGRPQPEQ